MALEAVGLIISTLQALRQLGDDLASSNDSCKLLISHCEILAQPVNQINENRDLLDANSHALQNALSLLVECRNFCTKFKKRNFFDKIGHKNRDKEMFTVLHHKMDIAAGLFTLQV